MNTTFDIESSTDSGLWCQVWSLLVATRTELFLFCAAVAAYILLFGNAKPSPRSGTKSLKAKLPKSKDEDEERSKVQYRDLDSAELGDVEKMLQVAFQNNDHRMVSRCWSALRKFSEAPAVNLAQVVESFQRLKKEPKAIASELMAFFQRHGGECDINAINELLEPISKRLDTALAQHIIEMLPSLNLRPDSRTYELLLAMHFTTRNFSEVKQLTEKMTASKVPLTIRASVVVIKAALKDGDLSEAMLHFGKLKMIWANAEASISTAPQQIVSQLVDSACKEHQLAGFLPLLAGVPITDEVVATMLMECVRQKNSTLASRVERLARDQDVKFSDNTYSLLIKASLGDVARVRAILEEIAETGKEPSTEIALAVILCCAASGHNSGVLADRLHGLIKNMQLPVLSAFVRYYAETDQPQRACDVYQQHVAKTGPQQGLILDSRAERSLMNAALRCGRHDLAKNFLEATPADVAKHVTMIRNCAAAGNLEGAKSVFEALKKGGAEINSVVYNTVLDACVECHSLKEAEAWMCQMKEGGFADVVSYNTLIKAHLQNQNFDKARSLMEEMKSLGLQPNRVTFNELVNGLVARGSSSQRAEIWTIIREMKEAGATPNQVTCSILLKSLNARSSEFDIMQTMDLIGAMEEPMDEVLLSSVVEACVRIGKLDLLASKLKQLQGDDKVSVNGSHTFGSLIKAYGYAKDINGVWRCWKEMRSRHIRPTSITLGCMVEAVVSNGDTEGAYELIHELQEDERCREVLNSVIYCSVLKGFTREKKLNRVWAVYEEMLAMNVDLSIVTYNTLIDACARCGQMNRVPEIVEDMKSKHIQPNLITYSTMLKGHCQVGDLQQGFAILEQMSRETKLKPDEIMYNSLLDGCAQNGLVDEGLKLLERMQSEGVPPSNFTLSLLVKLMSRARKLDSAFSIVEEISQKFRFKPNVHVYTNLIQACIYGRQLARGMSTLETMLKERVQPESRTYMILIRANIQQGQLEQAAGLMRAALGLEQSYVAFLNTAKASASCHNLDYSLISETLQSFMDLGKSEELAVPLMADLKKYMPRVPIDPSVQRCLLSGVTEDSSSAFNSEARSFGKGNGKNNLRGKGNNRGTGQSMNRSGR